MAGKKINNHFTDRMSMRQWYKGQIIKGLLSALNGVIISPEDQERLVVVSGGLADKMLIEDEQHRAREV